MVQIFIMYVAARLFGILAARLRQPIVIGELMGGIAIGAILLKMTGDGHGAETITAIRSFVAELGAIVLLFYVGLETKLEAIRRVGLVSFFVAVGGVILPFGAGLAVMWHFGYNHMEAAFMGAAMVATSVGVTARVLTEMGVLKSLEARTIIAAAVIDDVLGLLVLSIVSGLAGGSLSAGHIVLVVVAAVAFVGVFASFGPWLVNRWRRWLIRIPLERSPLIVGLTVCLGLAALAQSIGLAAIVGAFLAGMMFAEVNEEHELHRQVHSLYDLLVPLFFVQMGTQVNFDAFTEPSLLLLGLVIIVLAVLGKLIGCGLAALKFGARSASLIGIGMSPRGEVGLIVANVGLMMGIVEPKIFSVAVEMSIVTTLIAPPLLKVLWPREKPEPIPDEAVAE